MVREKDDVEKGIIKFLGGRNENAKFSTLDSYLNGHGYTVTKKELREKIDYLTDIGFLASRTEGTGANREEVFYLTKFVGGGKRARSRLQGRGPVSYVKGLYQRITGSIFLLFGLGFLGLQDTVVSTGKVISESATALDISFILSFVLMILGGILFYQSFKK